VTEHYASVCGFPESDHFFIYPFTASVGWRAIREPEATIETLTAIAAAETLAERIGRQTTFVRIVEKQTTTNVYPGFVNCD
jgi:hypothetical protein